MVTPDPTSPCSPGPPQMQLETEKERMSLLETLLQTQKELADASQQLERLRQDMKVQKLKEQETTGMLQTQLREAQKELEQAAQQHRDSLAALQEEGRALLQDKIDLHKQVEDLKSQLVSKEDSQRLVDQEVQEKLREAQECSRIQKELEKEKAR